MNLNTQEETAAQRQDAAVADDPTKKWSFRRRGAHIQAERSTRLWDAICGQNADCKPLMADTQAHRQKLYMTQREYKTAAAIGSLGNKYNRNFSAGPSEHSGQVAISTTVKSAKKILANLKKMDSTIYATSDKTVDDHLLKQLVVDLTQFIQNAENLMTCTKKIIQATDEVALAIASIDERQRNFLASTVNLTCEMNKAFPPFFDLGPLAPGLYGWKQRETDKGSMWKETKN